MLQAFDAKARVRLKIQDDDPELIVGHPQFNAVRFEEKERVRIAMNLEWFEQVQRGERPSGLTVGEMGIASLIPAGGQETQEGIDSILGGMVIGAWTAFETLASDLWADALNNHPVSLAALSGRWHKEDKFDLEDLSDDDSLKTIKLSELAINGYDLSKKMGAVHKYRFKWGVLEGIRRAYSSAFAKDHEDIKTAIESPSLDALAAARNILVHKAGIVDEKFKRKIKGWVAFSTAEPGTPLVLDGITVRDLLSASMGSAIELMRAVDAWLQKN